MHLCVAIVLMYFWLLGIYLFLVSKACILFEEFWFCIKGCSYVHRIMFLQRYLKNNYGLTWAISYMPLIFRKVAATLM